MISPNPCLHKCTDLIFKLIFCNIKNKYLTADFAAYNKS